MKNPKLTNRELYCLIDTLEEALQVLDNPALARAYRQILKKLFAALKAQS